MLLQTKNLDKLIFVNKNWPLIHIGFVKTIDLQVESNLTTKLEIKFQDDVNIMKFY